MQTYTANVQELKYSQRQDYKMIPKLFCLLGLLSMLIQGREASIVPVVETIPEINVTFGEEGLLKCAYERKPYVVYWKFVSHSSSSDLLVALDQYYRVGERSGPGYDEGRYNITNDFSLLIHDVSVEDEGRYICEVSDFETGRVVRNYTNVTVTVQAVRPLVRVHQCRSNNQVSLDVTDNPKARCMIQITPNQHHVQLDCSVEGAKPQVDMSWVDNTTLQDLSNSTSLITTKGKREGTVDQKLTVIVNVSEFQSVQEYFTCIAEGPAVGGIASVTIGINNVPPGAAATYSSSVVLVVVVVLLMLVVLFVFISVLLWRKYKRLQQRTDDGSQMDNRKSTPINAEPQKDSEKSTILVDDLQVDIEESTPLNAGLQTDNEESTPLHADVQMDTEGNTLLIDDLQVDIEESTPLKKRAPDKRSLLDTKRTKIKDYSPDRPTTMKEETDHINLGVFGLEKSGKSSLINSLILSLTGNYPGEADRTATTSSESDCTGQIEEIKLTDHIHILNHKGMVEYDQTQLKEILYHIKGQSKKKTPKVPLDCTIFICEYSNHEQKSETFKRILSNDVTRFFGRGIMLVIPKKCDLGDDEDYIKTRMCKIFGIPEAHVWIFENYTQESHKEDVERSIEFLDFILHCLTVAQENQQFRNVRYGKNIVKR